MDLHEGSKGCRPRPWPGRTASDESLLEESAVKHPTHRDTNRVPHCIHYMDPWLLTRRAAICQAAACQSRPRARAPPACRPPIGCAASPVHVHVHGTCMACARHAHGTPVPFTWQSVPPHPQPPPPHPHPLPLPLGETGRCPHGGSDPPRLGGLPPRPRGQALRQPNASCRCKRTGETKTM